MRHFSLKRASNIRGRLTPSAILVLGIGCLISSLFSSPAGTGPYDIMIANCSVAPAQSVIASAGATIVTESCSPPNGAIDPDETVTVSLCVQNVGTTNTTNLVGTLQATGGVTSPSGPQNYGVVVAGGPAVCRNFTFTASGSCGGTITATLQFQDGATNLGTVTYTFTLGTAGPSCCVSAPVIASAGATIVTEGCAPANGAIDPNETVTVSLCVQNVGGTNTTNLVGTLQATGGVTSPAVVEQVTVVVPTGKNEPAAGEQVTVPHVPVVVGAR